MSDDLPATDADLARHFRLFSVLWVLAGWFHLWNQIPWPAKQTWFPAADQLLLEVGMLAAGAAVIWMPGAALPFGAYVALQALHALADHPRVANHWYIEMLISMAIVASAMAVWRRDRTLSIVAWFRHFAPAARWLIVICYAFAAWAKFNTAFHDTSVSCASTTWVLISEEFLAVPTWWVFQVNAIAVTVVTEVAVPVLLLTRRYRHLGVLWGLLFHYLISIPPQLHVPDFALMLFASWLLFLPPQAATRIHGKLPQAAHVVLRGVMAAAMAIPLLWYVHGPDDSVSNTLAWSRIGVFALVGAVWVVLVLLGMRDERGQVEELADPLHMTHPAHWALLGLALFAGFTPYLGLRTTTNFTMFSNLAVEDGRNNHFVMPKIDLGTYQDDLVDIEQTSIPRLQRVVDRDLLLPFWELRYQVQEAAADGDAPYVRYLRGGRLIESRQPTDDPDLYAPISRWERFWLAFRPVDKGTSTCQW